MRLYCVARAGARGVLRSARTEVCGQRRVTPLSATRERTRARGVLRFSRTLAPGARETEQSRALLSLSLSLSLLSVRAERRTPSRRARAKQFSRMHGTKT